MHTDRVGVARPRRAREAGHAQEEPVESQAHTEERHANGRRAARRGAATHQGDRAGRDGRVVDRVSERRDVESAQVALSVAQCARTTRQELGGEGRVQHGEEELLLVRHDHTSAQRLESQAEACQARPGLGAHALGERGDTHGQEAHELALLGALVGRARERLLAAQGRGLRGGHEASTRSAQSRPRARVRQADHLLVARSHLGCRGCFQQISQPATPTLFIYKQTQTMHRIHASSTTSQFTFTK